MDDSDVVVSEPAVELGFIADFFEVSPPNQLKNVADLAIMKTLGNTLSAVLHTPELQLHCTHEKCNGVRFFRCTDPSLRISVDNSGSAFIRYLCSNCRVTDKIFAIEFSRDRGELSGEIYKYGELPPYGPPVPSRLISLMGPDRDEFLQGRRSENLGLGVAAFTYYRRVVERQKDRILKQIINVANKIGADPQQVKLLEAAVAESQFAKALDMAKDALPDVLFIDGHNPIKLLHGTLSEGVHILTDAECLEIASSVRVVLAELSERMAMAVKDEAILTSALNVLMTLGSKSKSK
jgi:hypothetical protein